ncbi:MAG: glycosyltransferase family 8 protein [Lachnospiraceae bacterium]|nr:glycosyltransferase family 8 protein [Lachnospiraceae bacterium]
MKINLATSTDDKYARYAYVMIVSALENKNTEDELHLYLLNAGLNERYLSDFKKLEEKYTGFTFTSLEVDPSRFSEKLPTEERWSVAMYYRLMLPDILPTDVERIIYLDVDIIINKPLNELYGLDFEGKLICACEDYETTVVVAESMYMAKKMLDMGKKYYNSGVLLINMAKLRQKYRFDDYMKVTFELLDNLNAPDQDVINYIHRDEIKEIDKYSYNLFAKKAFIDGMKVGDIEERSTVIHYATQKPWRGRYVHCETELLWWKYAKMTPYADALTDEFMKECLGDPYVYNLMTDLLVKNKKLEEEVELRKQINDKLLAIVEGNVK